MKTKVLFRSMLAATALVTAACSDNLKDDVEVTDPSSKTAIAFVGQDNSAVRTRAGFQATTLIAMHIRSTKDAGNIRETRTWANALKDNDLDASSYSVIEAPSGDNVRYWDDAYGRAAQLSVFAIAVPGQTTVKNNNKTLTDLLDGNNTWNAGKLSESIEWTLSTDQSVSGVMADEDLIYSNNIRNGGEGGAKSYNYTSAGYTDINDGMLKFRLKDGNFQDGPGKFDQGNLKFDHALSRITINLIKGTGYGDGSFDFASGTNVKILDFPTSGTLNLEDGSWTVSARDGITKMATTTLAAGASYSLVAQVLPGHFIQKDDDTNVLEFIIDDNKYFVTEDMMFNSLYNNPLANPSNSSTKLDLLNGRNYVFNITVGKSKIINVSATLEPWIDVTAAHQTMDNSHISLDLFSSSGAASTNFDLYRLNDESAQINTGASSDKNWNGNYTDKASLSDAGSGKWETTWFFENNKSFYHFRTVNENTVIKESDTDNDDYFEITSGDQAGHDYHWGAPFISSTTSPIQYDKANGYTAFLSPAIGATNSTVSLTELHMMSNINVVLRTTKTSNAVALEVSTDQCEVTLTHFYADGQVKMGNGLVSTTGSLAATGTFTKPVAGIDETDATYRKTGAFTFAAVPQELKRDSGSEPYVGITIKTPDNNQYYVVKALSDIIATSNGGSQNQTESGKIDFWYPNHSYTYTFTLTKAGIDDVTCTVSDWVNVTANNQNISLED